ncbi:MAG: hypothetical protein U5K69_24040 [Balneolaceae bacterium]|nr:hypothetical protein [Balneolaceae bacterium]
MLLLLTILSALLLFSAWFGYRQYVRFEHLSRRNVSNSVLAIMILLTLLSSLQWIGNFSTMAGR